MAQSEFRETDEVAASLAQEMDAAELTQWLRRWINYFEAMRLPRHRRRVYVIWAEDAMKTYRKTGDMQDMRTQASYAIAADLRGYLPAGVA